VGQLLLNEGETGNLILKDKSQTLPHHLRRAVEKFRRARDVVQGQFHFVDQFSSAQAHQGRIHPGL